MVTERAQHMVVLSVHVVGNGATHRHQLRAGSDRQDPAARNCQPLDIAQQHPHFAHQAAGTVVKGDEMVQPCCQPERALRVQACIAIAAAHAVGNTRGAPARKRLPDLAGIAQANDVVRVRTEAPPGGHRPHTPSERKT